MEAAKKVFDWSRCKWSPESMLFIQLNYNKAITEDEFVEGWTHLGRRKHSPHAARHEYQVLKKQFGFFSPGVVTSLEM